uniref:SPRY-associated domain-containing protein n=1 Tax=Paramormyrops kingsleyae TaxID=1676925 RepID=A0A3B3RF76_9TELE
MADDCSGNYFIGLNIVKGGFAYNVYILFSQTLLIVQSTTKDVQAVYLLVFQNVFFSRLYSCNLTDKCCEVLASALRSNSSHLRELDLSDNDLQDSGVKLLSTELANPHCKLEILRLSGCRVTEEGCSSLASALRSNPSHLRELDLSYNHPGDSGVKLLSAVLEDPSCKLEKLNVGHSGECRTRPGLQKCKCVCRFLLIIPLILCYGCIHTVVVLSVFLHCM